MKMPPMSKWRETRVSGVLGGNNMRIMPSLRQKCRGSVDKFDTEFKACARDQKEA